MSTMAIKIKIKQVKSRKGWQYYVYDKDTKKGRYYSFRKGSEKIVKKRYEWKVKKKGTEFKRKEYLKRLKTYKTKEPTVRQLMKKKEGVSSVIIPDIKKISHSLIVNKQKELLRPFVSDEGILDLLVQEGNMQKLKNRLEHKTIYYDEKNQEIGKSINAGKKTILEMLEQLKDAKYNVKADYEYEEMERKKTIRRIALVTTFRKPRT